MDLRIKILALCLLVSPAYADYSDHFERMSASNEAMKTCLLAHGYEGNTQLMTFNFSAASACFHDWKSGQLREEYIRTKLWLEEHPWYKGRDWNWQEMAKEHPGRHRKIRY